MLGDQLEQEVEGAIEVIEVDAETAFIGRALGRFNCKLSWSAAFENIHARTLLGLVASFCISSVESRQLRKRFDA
jgi:hypothetical protein